MTEKHDSIVMKKAVNEVKYCLNEHQKTMNDEEISKVAQKAINLFVNNGYSSLEAAVEDILVNKHII